MDIREVCTLSTRTTREPRPCLIPALARCARPAYPTRTCTRAPTLSHALTLVLPTCTDARSSMHTTPPTCLPSPCRLARRARTHTARPRPSHDRHPQPHGRPRVRSPSRPLRRIAPPSPSRLPSPCPLPHTPNSDVVMTTTRRSCRRGSSRRRRGHSLTSAHLALALALSPPSPAP
ncbi:hypothetical protein EV363DRAFT_1528013, partial [Boletus edulis]